MDKIKTNTIYSGHVIDVLRTFPDESIDMVITSPPYWGLRVYKAGGVIWDGDKECNHEWSNNVLAGGRAGRPWGDTGLHKIQQQSWDQKQLSFQHKETMSAFCTKCNAWIGELGLEPSFEDQIFEIEIMEPKKDLTKEDLDMLKKELGF